MPLHTHVHPLIESLSPSEKMQALRLWHWGQSYRRQVICMGSETVCNKEFFSQYTLYILYIFSFLKLGKKSPPHSPKKRVFGMKDRTIYLLRLKSKIRPYSLARDRSWPYLLMNTNKFKKKLPQGCFCLSVSKRFL